MVWQNWQFLVLRIGEWTAPQEDMQRWHLRGLELRFQENEAMRLKDIRCELHIAIPL